MDAVSRGATGTWVRCRVTRPSVHAEQGLMRQPGVDDAPVAPSPARAASSSSADTSLPPLLSRSPVPLLHLRVDRRAVAAVADRAAGHPPRNSAEHAPRAAQVFVGGEHLRGGGGREAEMGARAGGDRRRALRYAASWKRQKKRKKEEK